ncbi:DUF3265 domain-containing protein [Vibrio parahaemolyticus]
MNLKHNKQFKRDSARVAFLVCVSFSVEVPCSNNRYCVLHPLTGR